MAGARNRRNVRSIFDDIETLKATGELGLNALTGAVAYPFGAGAGLGRLLDDPDNPDVARNYGRGVSDSLTYQPRTQLAQEWLDSTAEAVSPLVEPVARGMQYVDDKAREQGYGDQIDTAALLAEGLGAVVPLPARANVKAGVGAANRATHHRPGRGGKLDPTVTDSQRQPYPDIYNDPRDIIEKAEAYASPENPDMKRIFGTDRQDIDDMWSSRTTLQPLIEPQGIAAKPKGGSAYINQIMTPENEGRLQDILTLAADSKPLTGSYGWYELAPLMQKYIDEWGPTEGMRRFDEFAQAGSALSSMSSPLSETQRFSLFKTLQEQGMGDVFTGALSDDFKGTGFGTVTHKTHAQGLNRMMEEGNFSDNDPTKNLKTKGYYHNKLGYPWNTTADSHFARQVGLADVRGGGESNWKGNLKDQEGLGVLQWYRDQVARPAGMGGAGAQALQWNAMGPTTGLAGYSNKTSIGKPLLEILTDQMTATSRLTGEPVEDVLTRFVQGNAIIGRDVNKLRDNSERFRSALVDYR